MQLNTRHSLRPLLFRGRGSQNLGHIVSRECEAAPSAVMPRFKRGIQYPSDVSVEHSRLWNTGSPAFAGDDIEQLFDS